MRSGQLPSRTDGWRSINAEDVSKHLTAKPTDHRPFANPSSPLLPPPLRHHSPSLADPPSPFMRVRACMPVCALSESHGVCARVGGGRACVLGGQRVTGVRARCRCNLCARLNARGGRARRAPCWLQAAASLTRNQRAASLCLSVTHTDTNNTNKQANSNKRLHTNEGGRQGERARERESQHTHYTHTIQTGTHTHSDKTHTTHVWVSECVCARVRARSHACMRVRACVRACVVCARPAVVGLVADLPAAFQARPRAAAARRRSGGPACARHRSSAYARATAPRRAPCARDSDTSVMDSDTGVSQSVLHSNLGFPSLRNAAPLRGARGARRRPRK